MDEKDDTLPMDGPDRPELVDEPKIQHEVKAEAVDEPQGEPEAKPDAPLRGPDGKFAAKEEKGDEEPETATEAPPAPEVDEPNVPRKALQEERRKRQELEQQIAAMQRQYAQQPPSQPEVLPDFWDNPAGVISAEAKRAAQMAIAEFQQQQTMERINASEVAAKGKYADYQDAFQAFQQAASANPTLVQQMTASPDPAEFAYRTGKRSIDLEKVGSIDELLKAERAKWEEEVKAAAPKPTFPASTASDGSAASRGGPVWSGPVQDKDLLPMG